MTGTWVGDSYPDRARAFEALGDQRGARLIAGDDENGIWYTAAGWYCPAAVLWVTACLAWLDPRIGLRASAACILLRTVA